ncbi:MULTISPECIES: hypothetical protein [Photorhabdus]|uniref:Uncharacterized protein n=1 Tax=Photorhabdus asymbiotica subsp. asymbiotica (strain ATCC 43949 / 3105-77) TaxID=553480 RepID=C7BH56_PHOAA|nr:MULTISPECIES: hypothetical protein [Photorhabdus]MCW7548436.1 hypothetical protein [Photorhabdus aballayi]CAQ85222.1 Hypothetical Protein PAU_03134 [Photorhabdus asymbiotica]
MDKKVSLDDIALSEPIDVIPDEGPLTDTRPNSSEKHPALILQEIEDRKADRALREKFGDKAYKVVRKTLYGWSILLFCYGFSKIFGFELFPDNVMIAITSAVTLNIFAAFLGVIRGLFPSQKSNKD